MTKPQKLLESFIPEKYQISFAVINGQLQGELMLRGKKVGRPSKRIVLHQKDLKVLSAYITKLDKKGSHDIKVERINHHKNFEELRLHTGSMLFPGIYEIKLAFTSKSKLDKKLKDTLAKKSLLGLRNVFPLIDEANANAEVAVSYDSRV